MKENEGTMMSLCRVADERLGLWRGISKDKFCGRISLNLQYDFHQACAPMRCALRPTTLVWDIACQVDDRRFVQ